MNDAALDVPPSADGAAVLTCFTLPGLIAGSLVGAVFHGDGPGVLGAAMRAAVLGGIGATVVGTGLAFALRAGINNRGA